ncbi:hypothetical protein BDW22DRAFT_1364258 [Trametopsis cervina]|nr:hypothetical protein BDW22DRAFT_1364258 [Trametopsis cervina]
MFSDQGFIGLWPGLTFTAVQMEELVPTKVDTMEARAPVQNTLNDIEGVSSWSYESSSMQSSGLDVTEYLAYSPPPTPTRPSAISRFSTPPVLSAPGTPSLLHLSLTSTMSSPSLAHTPMQYTTTRNADPSSSHVGLGFTGLFLPDGSMFDGMGALPKRDESAELGFFMDEAEGSGSWGMNKPFGYPEQEEDAWRKSISCRIEDGGLDILKDLEDTLAAIDIPSIRQKRPQPGVDSPTLPSAEDVFYSHMPMSSTPRMADARRHRKARFGLPHSVVTDWSRNVREAVGKEEAADVYAAR